MVRSVEMVIGDRAVPNRRRPDAYSCRSTGELIFFFLLSTLFANIRGRGGGGGLFLSCTADEKLENNPSCRGRNFQFDIVLELVLGALTEPNI